MDLSFDTLLPSRVPQTVFRGKPVKLTLSALRLICEELVMSGHIVSNTWNVETTFVLVFRQEYEERNTIDFHMTLVAPRRRTAKEQVFEDIHWTIRESVWDDQILQYTELSVYTQHYDLLASKSGTDWQYFLVKNSEIENNQSYQDPRLLETALRHGFSTDTIHLFLQALSSLTNRGVLQVSESGLILKR